MSLPITLAVLSLVVGYARSLDASYGNVSPVRYASGQTPSLDTVPAAGSYHLSPEAPVLTLDFGTERAGIPLFGVSDLDGPAQVEVKYAESFVSLSNVNSDGPWTFSNGLASSFRVETFNFTEPVVVQSFFVQGGQRWMSVRLLTGDHVTFSDVGFETTSAHNSTDEMPGLFRSSSELYNRIWDLGADNAQVACVDAGKAPSTWTITPQGALIRGQQTAQSSQGLAFANYTMTFKTQILRGGVGWTVASGSSPYGAKFYVTVDYAATDVFANTNTSLLPSNTLTFGYPWSIVNQTTLETGPRSHYPISAVSVAEGQWYEISTAIQADGYNVSIDGKPVAFVPYSAIGEQWQGNPYFGPGALYNGTWGFGPWQDQIAYIREVRVDAANGSAIYENAMTAQDAVVDEYSVAPLEASVCLDGAKRDRLVWIGDFYHTARIIASSTARRDYVLGTLAFEFARQRQVSPGRHLVPISPRLGATAENEREQESLYTGLLDYQFLFLAGVADYFEATADVAGLQPFWLRLRLLADAMLAFIDPASGLVAGSPEIPNAGFFLGPANGSAVTGLAAYTYAKLAHLATAFGAPDVAHTYTHTAARLRSALNTQLWNPRIGAYADGLTAPSNFSLPGTAWPILAGAANTSQAAALTTESLPQLRLGVGFRSSTAEPAENSTALSPNLSGFLLEALFALRTSSSLALARTLLDDFWSQMTIPRNDAYASGAGWEYMLPSGAPGLGDFTSLAHPWGAAPTYVLPAYVLGMRAVEPGFKVWEVRPLVGFAGLKEARGRAAMGLEVGWRVVEGGEAVEVEVRAPVGTEGRVVVGGREGGGEECWDVVGDGEVQRRRMAVRARA